MRRVRRRLVALSGSSWLERSLAKLSWAFSDDSTLRRPGGPLLVVVTEEKKVITVAVDCLSGPSHRTNTCTDSTGWWTLQDNKLGRALCVHLVRSHTLHNSRIWRVHAGYKWVAMYKIYIVQHYTTVQNPFDLRRFVLRAFWGSSFFESSNRGLE